MQENAGSRRSRMLKKENSRVDVTGWTPSPSNTGRLAPDLKIKKKSERVNLNTEKHNEEEK